MIGYLEGTIQHIGPQSLVLLTGGVGYRVFTTTTMLIQNSPGDTLALWTYLAVRENSLDLYGFVDQEQLAFFTLLLDVSGIGPKGALGIIEIAPVATLQKAIGSGDTAYLTTVSGIGKKMAAKIVLELKDKVTKMAHDEHYGLREESEALEALVSLGYSQKDAREALQQLPETLTTTQEKITASLKVLNT
ncbi:MAG: Holliday junction branch migration protein RuvA [Candidatus Pacebacteria bacterium]|nr:Holliday junction branch migration protein RuvA [Candidatus Paceibacterota bacterium]